MKKYFFIFCALYFSACVVCSNVSGYSEISKSDNSSDYRLPKNVLPESYDILLLTNVTRGDFLYKGKIIIDLRVIEKTNQIILHADKLKILSKKSKLTRVLNNTFEKIQINNQTYNNETQFYTIACVSDLMPGRYLLKLQFIGELHNDLFGFYRSSYRVNGEIRWIGVTQFSTIYARRAFPCMDEPSFKATFQLRIGHYGNETVSSNTFQESQDITNRPDYYITKFSRTPRMSTYILGWAIHDFDRVKSSDSRIWLWTRFNDSLLSQSLASSPILVEGPKIYSALDEWMALRNPIHKIEHFAVPDFHFNAMENWGLITFRESVPIVWYETTSLSTINNNLITLAHEYTHTWFGNIVTPESWNVGWLKEGFATYFAYLSIATIHPDWKMMDLFSLDVLQASLLMDSEDHNSILNKINVGSPKTAKAALDTLIYNKGASIIRMISDVVGENVFKSAIRSYLKERQYNSAIPSDIYKHLQLSFKAQGQQSFMPVTIGGMIESWANQLNYPLIRVFRTNSQEIKMTQEPFQLNRKVARNDTRFWWTPIKVITQSKVNQNQILEKSTWLGYNKSSTIKLPADAIENGWLILNPHQIGYYRVDYDSNIWNTIINLLNSDNFKVIPAINRAALLDDVFNLARAGYRDYSLALQLAEYLEQEDDYEPWVAASRAMLLLDSKLAGKSNTQTAFRRYATELITPIYEQLSFEEHPSDSRIKKMKQSLILSTACSLNLKNCVSKAKTIFNNWIAHENKPVPANFKAFIYQAAIRNGSDSDWINLWQRFLKTELHTEKEPMMNALGCTENVSFLNQYLEFAVEPDTNMAKQYRLRIIQSIVSCSYKNIDTVLNYVEKNLNKIIELRGTIFLEGILSAIGKQITSAEQENKLNLFVNKNGNKLGSALEAGKTALKSAKANIAWIEMCSTQISDYLS